MGGGIITVGWMLSGFLAPHSLLKVQWLVKSGHTLMTHSSTFSQLCVPQVFYVLIGVFKYIEYILFLSAF